MSENRNNGVTPTPNGSTIDQLQQLSGSSDPLVKALLTLANAVNDNPDLLRNGHRASRTSQSNISQNHNWQFGRNSLRNHSRSGSGGLLGDFEDGIRDGLLDSLSNGSFKRGIQGALTEFTNKFGFQLKDLPNQYGRYLGKQLAQSKIGQSFGNALSKAATNLIGHVVGKGNATSLVEAFKTAAMGAGGGMQGTNLAQTAMQNAEAQELFKNISKFLKGHSGTMAAVAIFIECMKPVFTAFVDVVKQWGKAFTRDEDTRKKKLENAQKRMQADINMIVEEPFKILTNAAQKWADAWDQNLSKISLTQGYTKEGVYDLYSAYAEALKLEDLDTVIPATDIVNNLSKIIDSGLSGAVAQAFAYESTKLSAAIPTEDFTSYASLYAQMIADARNSGKSQETAIAYANTQLETFASNLLYSSRTLTGGFTTGLKDAQGLLQNAVEIAQTAKTHNVAELSGVLTSVSAVVGTIAPDLASGLVQNVVSAAIGGNDSTIVALRSLAGINAGNTEFLRQMANDPQGVFVSIFRNLGSLQDMSPTNYMEVAEGLSKVFGIDMKAFARVDFNNLADKIASMEVNTLSLAENMALLQQGESVTTADQLRYQEINNQILDNGMSYIIDSEYGRMIQEHMWDEQRDNALMENEYAVNLQGAALEYLEGLRHTVANILAFVNPIGYVADGIARIVATNKEADSRIDQVAEVLEKGKVGAGNATIWHNLTDYTLKPTTDRTLANLLSPEKIWDTYSNYSQTGWATAAKYASGILFGTSPVLAAADIYNRWANITGSATVPTTASQWNSAVDSVGGMGALNWRDGTIGDVITDMGNRSANIGWGGYTGSLYSGFTTGKSILQILSSTPYGGGLDEVVSTLPLTVNATAESFAKSMDDLQAYIDSAKDIDFSNSEAVKAYYENAVNYGISDFEAAREEAGISSGEWDAYIQSIQSSQGQSIEEDRKKNIQKFIEDNRGFWDYESGSTGIFQTAMWIPFFANGGKFDKGIQDITDRIGAVSQHTVIGWLGDLSAKIGDSKTYTVISGIEQLHTDILKFQSDLHTDLDITFMSEKSNFQKCLADWLSYITSKSDYSGVLGGATAWSDLQQAEEDRKNETLLALANAMNAFSEDQLKGLDPQLQTNVLLGKIVIILEAIMQQNNSVGGLNIVDQLSAMGLGMMTKTT